MYKILLADDEGIMLASLSNILNGHFGNQCEIMTAKTGRATLELADEFRPDIIFLDIRMPGLNGIDAMREIREKDSKVIIIILTAYDKFDYAKDALSLGAFDFLTKPVSKSAIIDVVTRAAGQIEKEKEEKILNLRMREKLETVVPIIESGYISSVILQNDESDESVHYRELLNIQQENGYALLIRFGEELKNGVLTNSVGMNVRAQQFYTEMREIIKERYNCYVGPVMSSRVVVVVPCDQAKMEYEERVKEIENARDLIRVLESRIEARFRIGIGKIHSINNMSASYQEAYEALLRSKNHVTHFEDTSVEHSFADDYPRETEDAYYQMVRKGDSSAAAIQANRFFDWMETQYQGDINEIRLKILELVMTVERKAFEENGGKYDMSQRKGYLTAIMEMSEKEAIRTWFLEKTEAVCEVVRQSKSAEHETAVAKVRKYMEEHYADNLSLEEVSRLVNISPYYFSKLFKDEAGTNFIDYLTSIRVAKAKEFLKDPALNIKEVCVKCGYKDQNYFSRIFKKQENETPSEYRERISR